MGLLIDSGDSITETYWRKEASKPCEHWPGKMLDQSLATHSRCVKASNIKVWSWR